MLHYEAIEPGLLELLKKLMQTGAFSELRLAGGTSLALQIGYRKSMDLDLFGMITADELEISGILSKLGPVTLIKRTKNINIYLVDGVKVDLVNYHYPWLDECVIVDDIRLAGTRDIAAMKLAAITGRGTKKDFIDLKFLLELYKLEEMLGFYKLKFNDASEMLTLKSLTYFEDADGEEEPLMLKPSNWEKTKKTLTASLQHYLNKL